MNKSTFLALPAGIAIVVVGAFLGCAGRTDVTSGSDAAQNLPAKPHATPQLRPGASKLPSVGESAKHPHDQHKEHSSTSPATATTMPRVPPPDPSAAQVVKGFKAEVVMSGLTYASSVEFDGEGNLYVAEAGYSYGDPLAKPRVLRVTTSGEISTVAASGLEGPVNDLLWHDRRMYVAHRGKISVLEDGKLRDLVTGLPSEGDHHTNQMTVGPDGKIYFGQGTATNSGVVGIDNFKMGWLKKHPDFHDVPAKDVKLIGRTYETPNPLTRMEEQVQTSAFHPFGKSAAEGGTVRGQTKASGTILRMNADGSGLEMYAWGLRNPFGVMWSSDGKLYTTENGLDVRGSRPVANDKEDIYVIKKGAWYGWPDFAMGMPVTDARFKPEGKPQPQFVMADHPPVEKPWLNFPKHAAITKLEFSPSEAFGKGQIFVAFFGHMTPMTGKPPEEHGGHRVVRIDPATKKVETFFTKKGHRGHGQGQGGSGGHHGGGQKDESVTAGPRRLIDVRFSPDGGALYVADFGSMIVEDKPKPIPGTGVVWRIVPADAQPSGPPANLSAPQGKQDDRDGGDGFGRKGHHENVREIRRDDRHVDRGHVRAHVPERLPVGPRVLQPDADLHGPAHGRVDGRHHAVVHAEDAPRPPRERRHLRRQRHHVRPGAVARPQSANRRRRVVDEGDDPAPLDRHPDQRACSSHRSSRSRAVRTDH